MLIARLAELGQLAPRTISSLAGHARAPLFIALCRDLMMIACQAPLQDTGNPVPTACARKWLTMLNPKQTVGRILCNKVTERQVLRSNATRGGRTISLSFLFYRGIGMGMARGPVRMARAFGAMSAARLG